MSNRYPFRTNWCPVCDQGWIEIVKEVTSGQLFVRCHECLVQWERPERVSEPNASTLQYGKSVDPTSEEIRHHQWGKYLLQQPDDQG